MRPLLLLALASLLPCADLRAQDPAPAPPPFEIFEGDRVLFLGDALLEREDTYGFLETRLHEQFPDRRFTVRNLSWSGDTPLGVSRASFDPPEKGWERLKEQIALVKPTVVFLGYGMAASLQEMTDRSGDITLHRDAARYGREPMSAARFKKDLARLMDEITGRVGVPPAGAGILPGPSRTADIGRAKSADPSANDAGGTPASAGETPTLPGNASVRFVLLSPIRHEDLRALHPGLPDPAEHNKLLEVYTKVIEELAKERGARFVSLLDVKSIARAAAEEPSRPGNVSTAIAEALLAAFAAGEMTDNGIHLNEGGYAFAALKLHDQFAWGELSDALESDALRSAIQRKNQLFFHRWRPANWTYLFGFRKHEQGQNAVEIPKFDPLIAAADAEIDRLKRSAPDAGAPRATESPKNQPLPAAGPAVQPRPAAPEALPRFDVQEGYEIALWAANPLLEKPIQMNWDPQGRLWVASSNTYPQVNPEDVALSIAGQIAEAGKTAGLGKGEGGLSAGNDKIQILEDTDRDGVADKSTTFAEGLLIPTGVAPDMRADGKLACYVGASTELIHLADTDGDGRADQRRIVFSGFGTEDTHHLIHTLRWGPDGRLYFNQSIYIHSHLETPWGMVRLNSGGTLAYDPRTERVEVLFKGFCNPWGHAWDQWGQSFLTDGAGFQGITWGIPGAMYFTYENGRKIAPSISPGSYPKFAGLELIYSPHFPEDWQGSAVTCDFRAHRIVRFGIEDLGRDKTTENTEGTERKQGAATSPSSVSSGSSVVPLSGYATKELPDLVRTSDLSFRPIDVRLGPDGALYVADWSNPVINHGEVDFRDPRRDKSTGRIWRITRKGAPVVKWEGLEGKKTEELLGKVVSGNLWEKEGARTVLQTRLEQAMQTQWAMSGGAGWTAHPPLRGESNPPAEMPFDALRTAIGASAEKLTTAQQAAALLPLELMTGANPLVENITREHSTETTFVVSALRSADSTKRLAATAHPSALALLTRWQGMGAAALRMARDGSDPTRDDPAQNAVAAAVASTNEALASQLAAASASVHPRVRLEAMRALARIPTARSAELVLEAYLPTPGAAPLF